MRIHDRCSFAPKSSRTYDDKGYLHCQALVARSGIQKYYGLELGFTEPEKRLKLFSVYRPDEIVFNDAALGDYLNADITNDHPGVNVGADNFSKYSKGTVVSAGVRDSEHPEYVRCDLIVKDANTIRQIEAGKADVSAGYNCEMDFTPGKTPEGENYDAIVKSIKLNHVAIVKKGRAGFAHVCDSVFGANLMDVKIGAVNIALDDSIAPEVRKEVESMTKRIDDADALVEAKNLEIERLKAELDVKDAELQQAREEAESSRLTDADLLEIVKQAEAVRDKARKICGDNFVCDSVVDIEIIKAALKDAAPDLDIENKTDDYLRAYFDARVEASGDASASQKRVGKALADSVAVNDSKKDPAKERLEEVANAWKKGL